jgi:hypothetical protein
MTLRSGWLSRQDESTFVNFLKPIAERRLHVLAVLSDKQRGLEPAVPVVFPGAKHTFCQSHYLTNVAAPVAEEDETMKVALRKEVRNEIGPLVRQEKVESPGVLTVTGVIPTPVELPEEVLAQDLSDLADPVEMEREAIVQDILRRVRYLLNLKGRPPFRLAGIEMFERLSELATCLETMMSKHPDARLLAVERGLHQALSVCPSRLHRIASSRRLVAAHLESSRSRRQAPCVLAQRSSNRSLLIWIEIQQQSQHSARLAEFLRQNPPDFAQLRPRPLLFLRCAGFAAHQQSA